MYIADKIYMKDNRIKEWMWLLYGKAVLPRGGVALFCAFYYGNYESGNLFLEQIIAGMTIFLFFTVIHIAAMKDWQEHRIPDRCCMGIFLIATTGIVTMHEISLPERLLGSVIISVPMLILALCVQGAFGGGDIKLMASCGLFLGWKMILLSFVLAIVTAGVYALLLLWRGSGRYTQVPMGPFLELGMVLTVLFGK